MCQAAGPAVDALAAQYAGRAVFIEQDVDAPLGNRLSRFWAVFTGSTAYLPLLIADSGHQLLTGNQADFRAALARLVDPELARPPQAGIEAYARRLGPRLRVYATVRNFSGTTLSAPANKAAVHALVFEDARVGVTGRIIRDAPWLDIDAPLAPGGTLAATLDTTTLSAVDWNAVHAVVVADYAPGPGTPFDMMQAAVAQPAGLTLAPSSASVGIDSGEPADRALSVSLAGPHPLRWTALPDVPWLAVTPDSAPVATAATATVLSGRVSPGVQEGHVTFSAASEDGMAFTRSLTVSAVLAPRAVRLLAAPVTPGSPVGLPLVLSALGDERDVNLSLAFDPALLSAPSVSPGGVADAAIEVDESLVPAGRLGISVTLPAGESFPRGDVQLALVTFATATKVPRPTTVVTSCDQPVARSIRDAFSNPLTAAIEGVTLVFPDASVARIPRRHLRGPGT